MDCIDIKEARLRGEPLPAEAALHLTSCPVCSENRLTQGELPEPLDTLLAGVEGEIAREHGPIPWLRSRPTPVRVGLAGGVILVTALLTLLLTPRTNFAPLPVLRVVLAVTVLSVLVLAVVRLGLRPLQTPQPRPTAVTFALIVALGVPVLFSVLPTTEVARVDVPVPGVPQSVAIGVCFAFGAFVAALLVMSLRILDRGAHESRVSALLAAAAGGLAGNLALELHCPVTNPAHLLSGHATIGFVFVAAYALFHTARTRTQESSS